MRHHDPTLFRFFISAVQVARLRMVLGGSIFLTCAFMGLPSPTPLLSLCRLFRLLNTISVDRQPSLLPRSLSPRSSVAVRLVHPSSLSNSQDCFSWERTEKEEGGGRRWPRGESLSCCWKGESLISSILPQGYLYLSAELPGPKNLDSQTRV